MIADIPVFVTRAQKQGDHWSPVGTNYTRYFAGVPRLGEYVEDADGEVSGWVVVVIWSVGETRVASVRILVSDV